MHKSCLGTLVIDCQTDDVDAAARFWSAALGRPAQASTDGESPRYRSLKTRPDELPLVIQAVEHPSRVHLDIETDDIDAEVTRLEGLGARRIEFIRRWWVMEAPTGQRFCVVRVQREGFDERATPWPLGD